MIKAAVRGVIGDDAYLSLHRWRTRAWHWGRLVAGRDPWFFLDSPAPVESHGDWHLCPRGLDASSIIYSLGIGRDITFDLSVAARFGAQVHAFDPTPSALAWLSTQSLPTQFTPMPVGVAAYDGTAQFSPPDDPVNPSFAYHGRSSAAPAATIRCEVRRLSTLMRELGHAQIDLLKMDIEGAEYEVIEDLTTGRVPVRQLLVEFHHRKPGIGPARTREAVARLRTAGFQLFHKSLSGQEMAFLRDGVGRQ